MFEIKNHKTKEVIYKSEGNTLERAFIEALSKKINIDYADLKGLVLKNESLKRRIS